jgi:hypothetical protein
MDPETTMKPVATVTGLYRGRFSGLVPLTPDKPLTLEDVRRNPVFYERDLHPDQEDENRIIDLIYDNLAPIRLQDLFRGTDIPRGVRFWPDWFDIPPYDEMHDINGRRVYSRAPGIHTIQIRTARRKFAQIGRTRDFRQDRDHARICRCCAPIPPALCLPAEADPERDEGRCGFCHRSIGKNEHVKKMFWAVFVVMAVLVLARVLDPVTAQHVAGMIAGVGG